ncbi:MAG: type II CAAX endopeptidase family protein [Cyclobacteriaceae bacterium]
MNTSRYFPTLLEGFLLYVLVMALNVGFNMLPFLDLSAWFTWESITLFNHLFAFGITSAIGLLFYSKRSGPIREIFKKGDFCWCMTPSLITLSLLAPIVLWPINALLLPEELYDFFTDIYSSKSIMLFLALVITGPFLEELLFRGLILNGYLKHTNPLPAIVFSTLLFAFSHLIPSQVMAATIIGAGIGWLYYKTGSIIPALVVHVTFNLANYLLRFVYTPDEISALLRSERGFITGVSPLLLWSVALVLTVLIATYLYRQVRAHTFPLMDQ